MMKLLRKYNRQILAVVAAFLMIVFIAGSAVEAIFTPEYNPVLGNTRFGKITTKDVKIAEQTTSILTRLGLPWQFPLPMISEPLQPLDWVLLTREAEDMGMMRPTEAGKAYLMRILTADQIEQLSRQLRLRPATMYESVAQMMSIRDVAMAAVYGVPPSAAEIRAGARDVLSKVHLNAVVMPARAFEDDSMTVSEEEIQSHFEEFKDKKPGRRGVEFGYYVPAAVKLQYIKIDRDKIAEQIGVPNLDKRAREYYDENRAVAFRRPVGTESEESEGPASEFLSWEEAKDRAMSVVRKAEADAKVNEIAAWLVNLAIEPFNEVDADTTTRYRPAPEEVRTEGYYADLLSKLPERFQFADAVSVGETPFFTPDSARNLEELSGTYARDGQGAVVGAIHALPFRTEQIVPEVPDDDNVRADSYVATYQTSYYPLYSGTTGNRYVWRVLGVAPAHVPASPDEVGDQIVEDIKLNRAYEQAKSYARTLSYAAAESTLFEAFENDQDLLMIRDSNAAGSSIRYLELEPFSRASSASAGRSENVQVPGLGSIPVEEADKCFALADADERVTVIELSRTPTAVVVEWVETTSGREDEFEEMRTSVASGIESARVRQATANWLDRENIHARTGYDRGQVKN